jgi:hypothetical protein
MSVRNASPGISNDENAAVIVVGVKKGQAVVFTAGKILSDQFKPDATGFAAHIRSEDKYIVTQQPERSGGFGYAITQVQLVFGGEVYGQCNWKQALAFEVKGRKVIYLGDIDFSLVGGKISVSFGNNIEQARAFIDANYPKLSGLLEYDKPTQINVSPRDDCNQTIVPYYMPIYMYKK